MRFPPSLLDEIRARLPVSSVVARKVPLKKAGREFRGLSPFKQERTPSFFVNDQKGFYHCFASGEHGDIFTFLMKTEGLSFPEAVERLAAEAGVTMPKDGPRDEAREDERARLHALLEASARFFESQLAAPTGTEARRYIDKRGLARDTVRAFRLGFAPASRFALREHLLKAGFTPAEMVTAGMLIAPEDNAQPYDRFRNRVMFPITDLRDRVIAFGGRALDADAPAKYLNSPETPLFHKGHVLFNAARARKAAHDTGRIIAVEGYMDVAALHEGDFAEAVAPLGTALTEEQVALLWRMADEPILCFDGDSAGRKAAYRAIDTVLPRLEAGRSVRFAFLPNGLDPDDLIRQQGPDAMAEVLAATRSLSDVLWEREWAQGDWSTPERRARLERQLSTLVQRIADRTVRGHYERDVAERLAKAWGAVPVLDSAGRGDRRGQASGRPGGFRGPSSGWRGGRHGQAGTGMPLSKAAAGSAIRKSAMVAGQGPQPGYREALLLVTLLNHPWLIDDHAERIAGLPIANPMLARLRDAILAGHAAIDPLDSAAIRSHVSDLGLDKVVNLAERAITHRSDKFADPGAEPPTVEHGWLHAAQLQEIEGLRSELDEAVRVWSQEGSAHALARITEIKRLLVVAERGGDTADAFSLDG